MVNMLYFGDNLDICRQRVPDESVDLIYLDPPFNSVAQYNLLFRTPNADASGAQAEAFHDTWTWGTETNTAYGEIMRRGGSLARIVEALRAAMGEADIMAYLVMMAVRLTELRDKLKPTGSLYLHCDPTASHYLKIILDAVFGPTGFKNEVVWKRTFAHSNAKKYPPVHDVIFFYTKSNKFTFNIPRLPYDEEYLDKYYRFDDGDGRLYWRDNLCAAGVRNGSSGRPWRGIDPGTKGMHWKYGVEKLDELDAQGRIYWPPKGTMPQYKRYREDLKGRVVSDMWEDIDRINPISAEREGYPTQKPLALLERIISVSSNPGDVILDPFCGCGTTVDAAEKMGRSWVGIDIAVHAVKIIEARLKRRHGVSPYKVDGMPRDFASAVKLAERDPFQFQWWANYLFNPHALRNTKKGADKGVDGEIWFPNGPGREWGRLLISVKAGQNVGPAMVREFRGTLEREKAEMGLFICLNKPTAAMRLEAAAAGLANTVHGDLPRLQIVAIDEWFQGKLPLLPPLEHLPYTALASSRRRAAPTPKRPDPTSPELPLVFSGGRSERGPVIINPAMVRDDTGRRRRTA